MREYFTAEKHESLIFLGAGLAAIVGAIVLWRGMPQWRGMALSLAAIAAIQIVVGATVYARTDRQIAGLTKQISEATDEFRQSELARMHTVNSNFALYKIIEIALLAAGIVLTYVFVGSSFVFSLGHGLIIQSALMLVLDLFAERRGQEYVTQIHNLLGG